ncbi:MAG: TPM domain-containing protein [Bacteroidales bacterium]|nr:TPM domain-containing protein [Bacteroidales bacterium]
MRKHIISFILIAGFLITGLQAQDIPKRPSPPRLVNDLTGNTLSKAEYNQLEGTLEQYARKTKTRIAVVILNDLRGYAMSDLAFRIGEEWGVGDAEFNNGIVILVKPKTGGDEGETFIATGYGLEGAIPDAVAHRIVTNEMIPHFKKNEYYAGLNGASSIIMDLASGEYPPKEYLRDTSTSPLAALVPLLAILGVFLLMRVSRARSYSVGHGVPFWASLFLLGSLGGSRGGHWNDFSSGGGSFGGGGGFGGFGGGSFGGGGAGGSW